MTNQPLAAVIMAGGLGTRMRSAVPKHFHELLGKRLVDWVIDAARATGADPVVVVASPDGRAAFAGSGVEIAVQETPLGTGDAARAARGALTGFDGDVLVLSGDTPLLTPELLAELLRAHRAARAAVTILSARPKDARLYGRIVRDAEGAVVRIAEATDASSEELAIDEINSSIYVFHADALWRSLERLEPKNVQGELYLTDTIALLVGEGRRVEAHVADDADETEGVNTRVELARAGAVLRDRINAGHMLAGVTIVDPGSTWIDPTVELAEDVTVHPFTVLRGTTKVSRGAVIHPHSVVIDAEVGENADVGPFCYLRPGTSLGESSKAGTYVEIKNSRIGDRTKVPHLSYIGDAVIGADTNIGAGAITANLGHAPGVSKQRTTIGSNVRTAIHNGFIAPVEIGDGAWTGAGSVINKDVPPGALGIARARQENKEGYAARQQRDD